MVVVVVVVGGGCSVVIQEILSLIQKEKDINCNVLLSIQSMDKLPRMNVLQTPGFPVLCVLWWIDPGPV